MAKKDLNLKINKDLKKIVIKNNGAENKLIITFKRKKRKKFLENWYEKLDEFVEENKTKN